MTGFDLDTFRAFLGQGIDVATAADCRPVDVERILREEAIHLREQSVRTDEGDYRYELPSDDPSVDTHDVLAQMIAGSFGGVRIRYHDAELYHPGSDQWRGVWAVSRADSDEFVAWVNVTTFRTPVTLERYLRDLLASADDPDS